MTRSEAEAARQEAADTIERVPLKFRRTAERRIAVPVEEATTSGLQPTAGQEADPNAWGKRPRAPIDQGTGQTGKSRRNKAWKKRRKERLAAEKAKAAAPATPVASPAWPLARLNIPTPVYRPKGSQPADHYVPETSSYQPDSPSAHSPDAEAFNRSPSVLLDGGSSGEGSSNNGGFA